MRSNKTHCITSVYRKRAVAIFRINSHNLNYMVSKVVGICFMTHNFKIFLLSAFGFLQELVLGFIGSFEKREPNDYNIYFNQKKKIFIIFIFKFKFKNFN